MVRVFHLNEPDKKLFAAATTSNTPAVAKKIPAPTPESPLEPGAKRRARFLAAFGLVMISILALATGIALLRAFRQR